MDEISESKALKNESSFYLPWCISVPYGSLVFKTVQRQLIFTTSHRIHEVTKSIFDGPCLTDILSDDSSSQIQMTRVMILLKIIKFLQSTSVTTTGSSYCNAKINHISSSKSYDTTTNLIYVYSSEVKFRTSWVFMRLNNTDDPYRWLFSSKWMIRHRRQA